MGLYNKFGRLGGDCLSCIFKEAFGLASVHTCQKRGISVKNIDVQYHIHGRRGGRKDELHVYYV